MTTSATTTKGAWLARRARPLLAAYALVLLVELLQGLLLPERRGSSGDVVADTLGAWVGAVPAHSLFRSPDRGQ